MLTIRVVALPFVEAYRPAIFISPMALLQLYMMYAGLAQPAA